MKLQFWKNDDYKNIDEDQINDDYFAYCDRFERNSLYLIRAMILTGIVLGGLMLLLIIKA